MADPFYSSTEWRQLRAAFLRLHPVCETRFCGKRATHADHVVSRSRGGAPLDPANLQGLCHGCHSRKTAQRDGAFGRPLNDRIRGAGDDGFPVDPNHRWNRTPGTDAQRPQGSPYRPSRASAAAGVAPAPPGAAGDPSRGNAEASRGQGEGQKDCRSRGLDRRGWSIFAEPYSGEIR